MARYVYTQESGTNFKVNASDKADAQEDTNEVRQILDDYGELLGHTKFDDSYPKDVTEGGTLNYIKKSNFTSTGNPTVSDDSTTGYAIGSRWINVSTDEEYVCLDSSSGAAIWERTTADIFLDLTDTPANYTDDASKILTVTTGEDAVEFTPSTGIKLDDFGTPDDNTDLDASTGAHGLLLKRTGSAVTYLRADGTWATPTGTTGGAAMTFLNLTDTPDDYTDDATKILRVNASSGAVEFISSTGIKLDDFGTPDNNTDLNATTGLHGLLPALSGTSGEYLNGDANFVVPPASDIEVSEIDTATYDDVQDWINNTQSGGRISGGTISDDSSGGIAISSGTGFIQTTTGDIGLTKSFDWSVASIVSTGLTDNSANYIYIDYTAGSPTIKATATRGDIHLGDHFTLGRVYKSSGDLHILQSGVNLYNATRRDHERLVAVRGFERDSGGVISESAVTERAITSTIGNFYLGANKITTEAQDTSTGGDDYFTTYYYSDATWTATTGQTQISKTQYNTSTGLADLTVNRYGVHWAYIHFDSDIYVVYGQGDYTLAQAENAVAPDTLPSMVEDFGILASKIIIQQGSTGFNSIVTAYKVLFPVSNPAEHNDLGALDTADYQHLTLAEHNEITQWAGALTLSTGGAINLVTFSTGGTVNIPTGQEYQINGTEVKLDEWATPTTGTSLNATTGRHGLLPQLSGTATEFLNGSGSFATPTFLGSSDTPADFSGDANKLLRVDSSSGAVEFVSTTGIALDAFGTPTDITTNNATTGYHGLLLKLTGSTSTYLNADGSWSTPPDTGEVNTASNAGTTGVGIYYTKSTYDLQFKAIHSTGNISVADSTGTHTVNLDVISTGIALDSLGAPSTGTTLDSSTGRHGLLLALDGNTSNYLRGDGTWVTPPGAGDVFKSGAFTVGRLVEISTTGGIIKESPFAVTTGDVFDFGAHSAVFTEQAIATTTGTANINWNNGLKALFTRSTGSAGAVTFSFTAPVKSANLMLTIRGSAAGSTGTITWPTVCWQGGAVPILTGTASAIDSVAFYYSTGLSAYLGLDSANFSTV